MSHELDITTTDGSVFTYEQTCQMAELVYLRHGKNLIESAAAWRRLMQNSTTPSEFAKLIEDGLKYKFASIFAHYPEWWKKRGVHILSGSDNHDAVTR